MYVRMSHRSGACLSGSENSYIRAARPAISSPPNESSETFAAISKPERPIF